MRIHAFLQEWFRVNSLSLETLNTERFLGGYWLFLGLGRGASAGFHFSLPFLDSWLCRNRARHEGFQGRVGVKPRKTTPKLTLESSHSCISSMQHWSDSQVDGAFGVSATAPRQLVAPPWRAAGSPPGCCPPAAAAARPP